MAEQQALNRALTMGGATAISTGLAFAALNFLGMAQLLDYISGPLSPIAVLAAVGYMPFSSAYSARAPSMSSPAASTAIGDSGPLM